MSSQFAGRLARGESFGRPALRGIQTLVVDEKALARSLFSVLSGEVLFGDGEMARIPSDTAVEPREFEEFFLESSLPVFLGIYSANSNASLAQIEEERRARYSVKTREVLDENTGAEARPIEFRELIGRLFFGSEDRSGYECVQIARLVRGERPMVEPELDPTYIPALLSCGASTVLMELLMGCVQTLRKRAAELAASVPNMKNLSFAEKGADISGLVMLQSVNAALGALEVVATCPAVDPFTAYQTLSSAVGHLAIFGDERVLPGLPPFDSESLELCFGTCRKWLTQFAAAQPTAPYDALPFVDDAARPGISSLDLDSTWTQQAVSYFIGIELEADAAEVQALVSSSVKLVAPADMEKVIRNVLSGIELDYVRHPPIAFPSRSGLYYFKINTEGASRDQWLGVLKENQAIVLSTLSAVGKQAAFQMYVELKP